MPACTFTGPVGFLQLREGPTGNGLVIGSSDRLHTTGPSARVYEFDRTNEDGEFRLSAACCDSHGRVLVARIPPGKSNSAEVHSVDRDGSSMKLIGDLSSPTGLGLSVDERYLFVTDTKRRCIYRYS